ncbi:ABC transporter ATP-binding protein [Intestinibaculum porci]|uniref:ABC transporter ATP-binding protein n=1 Tax=Intestinibaculum porci TaxID=2487118 RepID=UPI002409FB5D|nr:ABC transporter ATP-binding protein [Intestinibaculum porci]MDD6348929.1 ABC transporter ATP-binding protein [Intestinibaculum porci]MDD6422944.1 ABC transporter ATP-binding protein [Intestinibaculum porci]
MEKEKFPTKLKLVLYFLQGSKKYFFLSIIFAILSSLFDLINPKIIGFTVDAIIGDAPKKLPAFLSSFLSIDMLKENLLLVAALVMLVALIGAICRYLFSLMNSTGAETLVMTMRNRLFEHIEHLPFAWYVKNPTGDLIQRCTNDVEMVKNFLSEQLTGMFRIIVMLVIGLTFMSSISVKLMLVALVFLPIIVLYSLFFHNKLAATFAVADEEEGNLSSIAQENLTGVRVVRAFGRERYEKARFEKQNDIYTAAYMKLSALMSAFWSIGDGISGLQVFVIVVLGTLAVYHGEMTPGNFIAFISYNAMLVWPIRRLGRVISEMSRAGVSIDRIRYIMNAQEEVNIAQPLKPDMHQDIIFDHVTFRYDEQGPDIIKDVSFAIEKGSTIGILGGTGSGKSTLMYLLDRLYPVTKGKITIGGVDIRDIDSDYLRSNIGLVLQEPYLFSRSLKDNIAIANDKAQFADIEEASRIASLDHAINHFKHGYDTFVGERGVTLSGGQKQRTAIAQMVIQHAPVMIFDDSLSALDAETDAKIRHALKTATGQATVILISHRITTLMNADQILVLNHGKIAEVGTHEELYKQNGIYKKICDIQNIGGRHA